MWHSARRRVILGIVSGNLILWVAHFLAVMVIAGTAFAQNGASSKWDERETKLANEYLSLLV